MARSFRPGTWKQCTACGEQYKPPTSLFVCSAALLLGSLGSMSLWWMVVHRGPRELLIVALCFALFPTLSGATILIQYIKTPRGPLTGFPVVPMQVPHSNHAPDH
ncbi:MAG TPA: hypothetical protein VH370_09635 [Humisphaera sp.]|jgi:hypothetical protein|nr:hypothetical protein [Humisphaera sp.]